MMKIVDVAPGPIAVRYERTPWDLLPETIMRLLADGLGEVEQDGHNVIVYRNMTDEGVDIEVGVQVGTPFADRGDVLCRETPGGRAATTTHVGPYELLHETHARLVAWARQQGETPAGVSWEIYGDWHDDPGELRTECFQLLG